MNYLLIGFVILLVFIIINNKKKVKEDFRACFPPCSGITKCCYNSGKCKFLWQNC